MGVRPLSLVFKTYTKAYIENENYKLKYKVNGILLNLNHVNLIHIKNK